MVNPPRPLRRLPRLRRRRLARSLAPLLVAAPLVGDVPASAAEPGVEAERLVLPAAAGRPFADGAASGGSALLVWSGGTASGTVTTAQPSQWLTVRARGDQCEGAPLLRVTVDGVVAATVPVPSTSWADHLVPGSWPAGAHSVAATYVNDHRTSSCDRNLRLDALAFSPAADAVEAETVAPSPGSGQSVTEAGASGGAALLLWSDGTARSVLSAPAGGTLVVRARGDVCGEPPRMRVLLDGREVLHAPVPSSGWTDVTVPGTWPGGARRVAVSFTNDWAGGGCDRNLRLDRLSVRPAAPAPAPAPSPTPATSPTPAPAPTAGNPFLGARGWVDPDSPARRAADARRATDPVGAAALDKVASGPTADWFGDWVHTSALAGVVRERVSTQTAAGALPVLVAYAVPHRDCGSHSAGGLADAAAYGAWVRELAAGIGDRKAVVVLEPDGLALMDCLTADGRADRQRMLADAVAVLEARRGTDVYVDAGGSGWHSPDEMAALLRAAGVAGARGFAVNVSNFADDATNVRYGEELSARLGGKHFVADTSRNGRGAGTTWCNPEGRGLGRPFTTATGSPHADAFIWVKRPGESDGTCGGGPPAGQWWSEYAVGLATRASW